MDRMCESWWGGYGPVPDDELERIQLQPGETWPQQELYDRYSRADERLAELAAKTRHAAGNDTTAPQWRAAWAANADEGVRLWREVRWCAERIRWAA